MRVDELKNKILQLAIQGKLVEQNPEDIPASILLKEIEQERKKLKKENELPEIIDEEKSFPLPNGWEFIRLGEFIRFVGGSQPPKSTFKYEYSEGYIRLIQIRDYKSDRNITYIPYEKAKKFCSKDDIMIGRYGPPIFQILRGIEGAYNVALMKADPIGGIEKDYLYYLLKDSVLLKKLEFLASRTCGQDGIDMNTLKAYVVGLPPREEQLRIVAKLDSIYKIIDELSENKEEMLKTISDTRNKVLQLAIQGKLVEQCEDDEPVAVILKRIAEEKKQLIKEKKIKKEKPLPEIVEEEKTFELPKGWEWCRLGEVLNLLTDYHSNGGYETLKANVELLNNEDYAIMVRITNLGINPKKDYKYITKDAYEFLAKSKLYKNDIVMSKITDPGTVYLVPKMNKPMSLAMNLFLLRVNENIDSKYIFLYLKARADYVKSFQAGTSTKTITKDAVKSLILALPPIAEQQRIVDKVDEIMEYLNELEKTILAEDIM